MPLLYEKSLLQDWHLDGFITFIQHITSNYDDVWFVTVQAGLDYRMRPVSNDDLLDGALWDNGFGCDPVEVRECADVTCV